MKIGIAGAGIGGLAAAALMAHDGHGVDVFDQFEAPKSVGSGLVMQPVGLEVLDAMGAGDTARALGQSLTAMRGHEADNGAQVLSVNYGKTPDRQGLAIHRAALFHAIHDAALHHGAAIHASHPITGRDGQTLLSGAKLLGPFDLIVDASGAASPLSPLTARALPYGAIWATVPWPADTDLPSDQLSQCYRRADRMLGVLPIGALPSDPDTRLAAVFYSLPADAEPVWLQTTIADWRAEALSLWPAIAPFLPKTLTHADFTFARYTHGSLRRPYSEGLVHIGDAAHRASPQLGQGANMALLDAMALTKALRQARGEDALRLFVGARRWHVAAYQAMSAAFTPQYQSDSRWLPKLRDHVLAPLTRVWPVPHILTRLVCGDLVPPMPALTPLEGRRRD